MSECKQRNLSYFRVTDFNDKISQKFWNILVMWGTIPQLRILLLRLWKWQTTLDSEMLRSPDTLQVLLAGSASTPWKTDSEPNLRSSWLSRFLQLKWNFLNYMVTVLCLLLYAWQMFLVASTALWPSLNSKYKIVN